MLQSTAVFEIVQHCYQATEIGNVAISQCGQSMR